MNDIIASGIINNHEGPKAPENKITAFQINQSVSKIAEVSNLSAFSSETVSGTFAEPRCRRAWVQIAAATLSGNSLRQTVYTHCASVHQAAKLVAALLGVVRVTADLAESNGSLPLGL